LLSGDSASDSSFCLPFDLVDGSPVVFISFPLHTDIGCATRKAIEFAVGLLFLLQLVGAIVFGDLDLFRGFRLEPVLQDVFMRKGEVV